MSNRTKARLPHRNKVFGQTLSVTKKIRACDFYTRLFIFPLAYKKNCAEIYKSGERKDGVFTIKPDNLPADVFCDQTAAGGGWTVFQKRLDGSVDFYRGWVDYKNGFGNLNGEFWLGLDKINRLTKTKNRLRVDLEDTTSKTAYAEYNVFAVTSERTKYKLSLGSYSGKFSCFYFSVLLIFQPKLQCFYFIANNGSKLELEYLLSL